MTEVIVEQRFEMKPMSANQMYVKGRIISKKYREWRTAMSTAIVKPWNAPKPSPSDQLRLSVIVAFSNKNSDLDNTLKPLQDFLQQHYNFNDKQIVEIIAAKANDVKRGHEYFDVKLEILPPDYERLLFI